mgnify:CR=1 FL=1
MPFAATTKESRAAKARRRLPVLPWRAPVRALLPVFTAALTNECSHGPWVAHHIALIGHCTDHIGVSNTQSGLRFPHTTGQIEMWALCDHDPAEGGGELYGPPAGENMPGQLGSPASDVRWHAGFAVNYTHPCKKPSDLQWQRDAWETTCGSSKQHGTACEPKHDTRWP